jgi:hypothetical protein
MTTPTQRWTVETGQNEYGWFESYAAAYAFAYLVGGGMIHEYRLRLTETKEISREEYEELMQAGHALLDPSEYASNG